MSTLPNKVVLVTGCSSGIGKATALRLARDGYVVYATARRVSSLGELEAAGCRTLALDVTDEASMVAAVRHIEAEHGSVGALVNNAGYSQSGAVESVPLEAVRAQFETNVFGLLRLTQLVLPAMRKAGGGRVLNVSSMGGTLVFPGGGVYHASKYAVEALSDALRFELRGFGVDVVLIQPGIIKTGFAEAVSGHMGGNKLDDGPYKAFNAAVLQATVDVYEKGPLAKLGGVPEDVAGVISKALAARRPRARYPVTMSASMLMTQRQLSPDWAWDLFLSTSFPQPQAS